MQEILYISNGILLIVSKKFFIMKVLVFFGSEQQVDLVLDRLDLLCKLLDIANHFWALVQVFVVTIKYGSELRSVCLDILSEK